MATWSMCVALVVTVGAVWALIKRYETRLVLLTAGLLMAVLSLEPMIAFKQFDKSMTNGSLIIAICSAMGFASVVALTKCDVHLVALLTKPLRKLGLLLLPACMLVVSFISIAIPSTSGLVASVGPTVIPLLIRAGFHPAMAAAAVVGSITMAYLSPGVAHNAFVSKLADIPIIEFICRFMPITVGAALAAISGNFGRLSSPLAGGMIIAAGIAGVSPFAIVKRTAPVMFILLVAVYILS